ncbi:uncharacterized protein [Phaseolus vulgaris]|uniref:uncharacterized protein n=1 Tax=Phaseolus vulgaris TaxID=3885 RepID=UPI0035C9E964
MGSTTNNNNDTATEEHRTILQTLQIQMQELLQKGAIDQLRQEEEKKRQEEERQRHAEEIAQLKEQNKRLMERLEQSEREGHSRAPSPPPLQSGTKTIAQTIPPTSLVQHTHQSVKQVTPNRVANPRGHPFTDDIIATPLPDKWKGLTINLYDGSTDPDEHLNIFRTQMTLYTTDRTVWCKVFPTSLREGPLGWFSDLPPNSITSFDALELKFTTQYATSRPHRTSSMSLLNVKQERGESLRTFMNRFSKVCMSIRNLNPEIAMHHLVSAILPRRFTEKNADRGKGIRPPIVPTDRDRHRPNRGPRFHSYTPLIVPRGKVLDEALQIELIPALKQSQTPPNADTSKRCQYHRNYGHTTEGCQTLKDKIEELVQAGHLRKFVKATVTISRSPQRDHDPRERVGRRDDRTRENHYCSNRRKRSESPVRRTRPKSESPERRSRTKQKVRAVINTIAGPVSLGQPPQEINYIAGGFADGGCSNSARKKHLRAIQFVHTSTQRRPHIPPITFTDDDFTAIDPSQDDPMVITVEIDKFAIAKVLVDQGSSVDILYWETFKKMKIPEAEIQPYNEQIVGFSGERVDKRGFIDLYTTFGDDYLSKTINIRYLLVNANTSYNILLGRPSINRLKAIVSTPHLAMKFPSVNGDIATVHVDQKIARKCYVASLKVEPTRRLYATSAERTTERRGRSPERRSKGRESRRHLVALVDLDPRLDDPRMEAGEDLQPIFFRDKDRKTHMGTSLKLDDREAIGKTLTKNADLFAWTAADMSGVKPDVITHRLSVYKEARPIAQKKRKLGEERRKAAREETDKLVQTGFIQKAHYTTWLANVVTVKKANGKWRMCVDYTDLNKACPKDSYPLPTIDRLVDGAAGHQILSFLDAYSGYNQIQMYHRDREKTAFRTDSDNFFYEVMPFGLKNVGATYQRLMNHVFHDMIGRNMEVYEMRSPSGLKEIQRIVGRLTSLSRFVPKLVERTRPIIKLLKKTTKFEWTDECEQNFQQLKTFLSSPPVIQKPNAREPTVVYLAVSNEAVSSVLVQEIEAEERPVYFISRVLHDAETRYQMVEKVALALVITARQMRMYFQNHKVMVKTNYPIMKILIKPDLAGRMIGWAVELSEFHIEYQPRGAIKSQALADFTAELTPYPTEETPRWTLYVDGSSNSRSSGAGVVLEGPGEIVIEQAMKFEFKTSNNQAEYEAIIAGLHLAIELEITSITCKSDSRLVVGQLTGEYEVRETLLQQYFHFVKNLVDRFKEISFQHVRRENNTRADALSRLATLKKKGVHRSAIHVTLAKPSVGTEECMATDTQPNWMTPIKQYLTDGVCDSHLEKIMKLQAARYILIGQDLYRRGYSRPLLKCLSPEQVTYVMTELHEGICGTHSGARTMSAKILRAGYYWPTVQGDCTEYVQKCVKCQEFDTLSHQKPEHLHYILSPLAICEMGNGYYRTFHTRKRAMQVPVGWFGLPQIIITDNGRQFTDRGLAEFYEKLHIKHITSSVEHPQTNGQAEAANKVILNELKKRLGPSKGNWTEELLEVLWAYRCTPQSTTQETPYSLTYGTEAMIPVEIGEPSLRRQTLDLDLNKESLLVGLDLINELRDKYKIREEACKIRAARRYNSKVKPRSYQKGDLVWRMRSDARKDGGKFSSNWEGPFRISDAATGGAYYLEYLSGKSIPRTWNATHLKFYYS